MEVSNREPEAPRGPEAARDPAGPGDLVPVAELPAPAKRRRLAVRRALLAVLAIVVLATIHQVFTWPDVAAVALRPPETTAFMERYRAQRRLGEREAAQIAAALPNPTRWHPGAGSSVAAKRTERILGRMRKATWLASRL